jgi:RimJ/RimL family protein N-acetyltransferase
VTDRDRDPRDPDSIATERLVLTPLRVADAEEMSAVLGDPALYEFIGGSPPTPAQLRDRYTAQVAGPEVSRETWRNWIIRERETGAAAGYVQATIDADGTNAEIAWVVGTPWQGRGYASEAARAVADWLAAGGVATIAANVHPDHEASAAVARAAGLTPTDAIVDGERVWHRPGGAGSAAHS